MAASILAAPHPLSSIPLGSELAITFELEDLTIMPVARLAELAIACSHEYPVATAYLRGLLEQRMINCLAAPCDRHARG
jgi:hypothetical protein